MIRSHGFHENRIIKMFTLLGGDLFDQSVSAIADHQLSLHDLNRENSYETFY